MKVTTTELPGRHVVLATVRGEVEDGTAREFGSRLIEVITEGCRTLYIDLRDTPAMSELALRELLRVTRKMRENHGTLHLVAPQPGLRGALRTTTLDRVISIHDTDADVPGADSVKAPVQPTAAAPVSAPAPAQRTTGSGRSGSGAAPGTRRGTSRGARKPL